MTFCICDVLGRLVRGCPVHAPGEQATPESTHVMLIRILENQEKEMAAIDNLKAADTALKAEITTFIADWQAQLAASGSANDPAIQAVADDMNATIAQLQGADPANAAPAPAPADGGDGTTPAA